SLCISCTCCVYTASSPLSLHDALPIFLDVDTGVDDAAALLYMLFKPQYDIAGIGTVCGNVEAQLAAENTLKVLDLADAPAIPVRSEEHTSELQSRFELVCRLLLEKKKR